MASNQPPACEIKLRNKAKENSAFYDRYLVDRYDLFWLLQKISSEYINFLEEKAGAPTILKKYPDIMFEFLAVLRVLHRYSWRALEGEARTYFSLLKVPIPHYSTIYRRCRNISLDNLLYRYLYKRKPDRSERSKRGAAIDSSGLKIHGRGEWLVKKHKDPARSHWLKIHFVVEVASHEILAYSVTLENVSDNAMYCELISEALDEEDLMWVYGDGAYDSRQNYKHAKKCGYIFVCKPRKNASSRSRGCPQRAEVVLEIKSNGLKSWKHRVKYGNRWSVERAYSTFKRIFGDRVQARLWERILDEIRWKVQVYNYFMRLYQD